jgi:hypothetical protein
MYDGAFWMRGKSETRERRFKIRGKGDLEAEKVLGST